ncbi:hypothetical protein GQ55_9G021400 [Panicum hallii var. hallii]|uniref:DUF3615 domain-containing protein n=1 Tax=Panicum hallii var. hallii TaxID=1504633 RepID=A0A2T7BYR8_9POAL|nr:hypothetical protein GQ55_9G021400 [Panicum hallii var. hallii]
MAGTRGKRTAEASSQTRPDLPKPKRGAAAPAAPPLGVGEAPAAGSAPSPWPVHVHTRETMHLDVAHTLRSGRKVFFLNTDKPGPMQFRKGEKPVYDISWRTPACAKVALKHYNRLNQDEHELVKAVDSKAFFCNGQWMHANFLAKSKGGTSCAELVPKYFFAELRIGPEGKEKMRCVSCIKMDPDNPETAPVRGCSICPSQIFHPAAGGNRGASGNRAVSMP